METKTSANERLLLFKTAPPKHVHILKEHSERFRQVSQRQVLLKLHEQGCCFYNTLDVLVLANAPILKVLQCFYMLEMYIDTPFLVC